MSNKTNIEEDIKTLEDYRKELGLSADGNKIKAGFAIENILADRERLEKENRETIPYHVLYDFLITSVDETQKPIWTEEHIEELLDNFIIKWKEKEQ